MVFLNVSIGALVTNTGNLSLKGTADVGAVLVVELE